MPPRRNMEDAALSRERLIAYHRLMENAPSADEQALMKRWVEQWKITGPELERIKKDELRAMTEEEAFESAQRLSSYIADAIWIDPQRRDALGLIEQQRLFSSCSERVR